MKYAAHFLIALVVVLTACSSRLALDDQYQPLARAVQQGNGFLENKIDDAPSTPVNGASYMEALRQNSTTYYDLLEPYEVEVLPWESSEESGFSVTVYDDDLVVLHDCNNTLEIDGWYYEDCHNTKGNVALPPCFEPIELIDE